ncbi:MAG TPA: hypothetical protein DD636_02455 [Anaerolineaceae bacterium]|nr:hypothetical protein [Anaerolineaceae bacterium]
MRTFDGITIPRNPPYLLDTLPNILAQSKLVILYLKLLSILIGNNFTVFGVSIPNFLVREISDLSSTIFLEIILDKRENSQL